ncbi:MAG: hypothetical protein WC378_01040 [Opitutaceae bacterium]|jgi:hypothetical protein
MATLTTVDRVSLSLVSAACGISRLDLITKVFPLSWGVPGHYVFGRSGVAVTRAKLPELADELAKQGRHAEANALRGSTIFPGSQCQMANSWYQEGQYA